MNSQLVNGVLSLILVGSAVYLCSAEPLNEKPTFDLERLTAQKSSMNDALVKAAGYLKYELEGENSYETIDMRALAYYETESGRSLMLANSFGPISFSIEKEGDKYYVGRINLYVVEGRMSDFYCTIEKPGIEFSQSAHYACDHETSYDCKKEDQTVAKLVFQTLEFEIKGDPKLTKDLVFTTEKEHHDH